MPRLTLSTLRPWTFLWEPLRCLVSAVRLGLCRVSRSLSMGTKLRFRLLPYSYFPSSRDIGHGI